MKIPTEIWQEAVKLERQMRGEPDASLLRLLEIAGLDPNSDIAGNDWRYVKFDGLDLRNLDFRNTRLHCSTWDKALVAGAHFEGSTIQETKFHKALDWRKAHLTDDQRADIELKALFDSEDHPSLSQIEGLKDKSVITPQQWVGLIKRAGSFEEAHSQYRIMVAEGKGANKAALTTLLDKAETMEEVKIVDNYFISNPEVEFDSYALSARISKSSSDSEALEIYNRYKNSIPPTQYVYNSLLAKFAFFEAADSVINMMREDGISFDSISLNKMIWESPTYGGAKWLYDKVKEPRSIDLTALISHAEWSDFQEGGKAYALLQGLPGPDEATFNVMIGKCKTFDQGYSLYNEMKERGLSRSGKTAYPLLRLIRADDGAPIDRAFNLLTKMQNERTDVATHDILEIVSQLIVRVNGDNKLLKNIMASSKTLDPKQALVELSDRFASPRIAEGFRNAMT